MIGQDETAPIAWHEELTTGIPTIDAQHQALFDCLTMLEEATRERTMIRTCYVLERLSSYVHNHFADEEQQMRLHDYPGLAAHIREHRHFTNEIHRIRRIHLERDITADLVSLLRDWLLDHVSRTDMAYVPYLVPERRLLPLMPIVPDQAPAISAYK